MQGRRILVVDDHASICTIVKRFLAAEGVEVTVEHDGHAALGRALNEPFDLVIADVEMPLLGGLDLVRVLRHVERTKELPVIIISAQDTEEDHASALAAGANLFLAKPFGKEALVAAAESLLEGGEPA